MKNFGLLVLFCAVSFPLKAQTILSGDYKITGTLQVENKVDVLISNTNWADFAFAGDYRLPSLNEVKQHIAENSHLPGIPSEAEVKENGVNLGEMQVKLLQKIEELTLYVIQQQEEINTLKNEVRQLKEK